MMRQRTCVQFHRLALKSDAADCAILLANPAERKSDRVSSPAAEQQVAAIQQDHNNVPFIAIFGSSRGFRLFLGQLPAEA